MGTITLTPAPHSVFNEFDSHGLLLGLPRLKQEKNAVYKQRLLNVMVDRGSSAYKGLINSITRELGLKIQDVLLIKPVKDGNGIPLATNPAVVFEETKCFLYNDFCNDNILLTIDRFDTDQDAFTLQQLVDTINDTALYTATILGDGDPTSRSMTIFNQTSVEIIPSEDISEGGIRVRLENINLIPGTASVGSVNLTVRKDSPNDLQAGEYNIDLEAGIIFTAQVPAPGSVVRYRFRNDNFIVQASPVIIHKLQSDDFRGKMFEQVCDDGGELCDGLPTALGADIINELLSVFATSWGI